MTTCKGCGCPLMRRSEWYALDPETRAELSRSQGYRHTSSRNLCTPCGRAERKAAGRARDNAARIADEDAAREQFLEDVEWMAETGECATGAARRLGMKREALEKRLKRADRSDLYRTLAAREGDWNSPGRMAWEVAA